MRLLNMIGLFLLVALSAWALATVLLKAAPVVYAASRRGMATRKTALGLGVLMPETRTAVVLGEPSGWEKLKAGLLFFLVDQRGSLSLDALREMIVSLRGKAEAIQNKVDAEKREFSAEESTQFDGFLDAAEAKQKELKRRERLGEIDARLEAPGERRTQPADDTGRITGGEKVASKAGTFGFKSFGEFANKVRLAGRRVPVVDSRLMLDLDPRNGSPIPAAGFDPQAAATTYGAEGVGADGGYLVPPDFKQQLLTKVMSDESLLSYCDQVNTNSNSVTFPADEDEPWSSSGIQVYWEGEATAPTQTKPALRGLSVHTEKLIALVPVTDELLQDSAALQGWLMEKAPAKIDYKVNDAIINGSGAGKPLGILNSPALITQAAEGGQSAATIVFKNVTNMWSQMRKANRRKAIWIANQDAEQQFPLMVVPGSANATLPAYLPAGGLSNSPFDTLMGRPVVYSEATAALGTPGDIMLADMSQYLAVVKGGGVRTDISIHLFFDQDVTAYRFILRIGGKPWWGKKITRPGSKLSQSAYIALASR